MFFFFPTDIPPSVPSVHPCISKSGFRSFHHCGADACRPRLLGYFQPLFPLLCTLYLPLLLFSALVLCWRRSLPFVKGWVGWFSPPCQRCSLELLLMLAVPTRGNEAAQCEPWRGRKNRLAKMQLLLEETRLKPFHVQYFCSSRMGSWAE